jgi:hypothetical protein
MIICKRILANPDVASVVYGLSCLISTLVADESDQVWRVWSRLEVRFYDNK